MQPEYPEWGQSKNGMTSLVTPYDAEFREAFWEMRSGWPRKDVRWDGEEWQIADHRVDEVDALLREHFGELDVITRH